jgi:hypothetical protein
VGTLATLWCLRSRSLQCATRLVPRYVYWSRSSQWNRLMPHQLHGGMSWPRWAVVLKSVLRGLRIQRGLVGLRMHSSSNATAARDMSCPISVDEPRAPGQYQQRLRTLVFPFLLLSFLNSPIYASLSVLLLLHLEAATYKWFSCLAHLI